MSKPQESAAYNPRQVQELKRLIAQGEGATLEFKRKASYPDKIVHEMIAFANAGGGTLLVGVSDDKSMPGLKYPEDDSHVIREALKKCRPMLQFRETFVPLGGSHTIIRYDIPESKRKPHYFNLDAQFKECYIRVDDKCIKASREVREIAKRAQQKKDIRFNYGEYENLLMKYLDAHGVITLKKFMEISGLKRFYASKKLVLLVLASVLRITPHDKGDLYTLAFEKKE
ncbi:MAG: helix-turn-helix domain-containing protein [Bacteroidota bacterium]